MRAGLLAAAAVAVALAGCGGDDDKKSDTGSNNGAATGNVAQEGAQARSDARNAATVLEACFADNGDYTPCGGADVLGQGGVEPGTGPGQVEVADAAATTYTLTAYVNGGKGFSIEKAEDGTVSRSCDAPEDAGCKGGTW